MVDLTRDRVAAVPRKGEAATTALAESGERGAGAATSSVTPVHRPCRQRPTRKMITSHRDMCDPFRE